MISWLYNERPITAHESSWIKNMTKRFHLYTSICIYWLENIDLIVRMNLIFKLVTREVACYERCTEGEVYIWNFFTFLFFLVDLWLKKFGSVSNDHFMTHYTWMSCTRSYLRLQFSYYSNLKNRAYHVVQKNISKSITVKFRPTPRFQASLWC